MEFWQKTGQLFYILVTSKLVYSPLTWTSTSFSPPSSFSRGEERYRLVSLAILLPLLVRKQTSSFFRYSWRPLSGLSRRRAQRRGIFRYGSSDTCRRGFPLIGAGKETNSARRNSSCGGECLIYKGPGQEGRRQRERAALTKIQKFLDPSLRCRLAGASLRFSPSPRRVAPLSFLTPLSFPLDLPLFLVCRLIVNLFDSLFLRKAVFQK